MAAQARRRAYMLLLLGLVAHGILTCKSVKLVVQCYVCICLNGGLSLIRITWLLFSESLVCNVAYHGF